MIVPVEGHSQGRGCGDPDAGVSAEIRLAVEPCIDYVVYNAVVDGIFVGVGDYLFPVYAAVFIVIMQTKSLIIGNQLMYPQKTVAGPEKEPEKPVIPDFPDPLKSQVQGAVIQIGLGEDEFRFSRIE